MFMQDGPLDTPKSIVEKITFQPRLNEPPFPIALLNELEKAKRKNKESHVF